ncbi:MAG: T9SS C-terminal target domain-containing protein [Bacteroidetes bacterium]|nr:MAG: T9SS C-terminal target domain-containing protein [Bacteroidota bacterium]TAG90654.1 MAG: T9SS C-terminal target domain-containing protein [Bacteroidota bacterium]
MKKTYLLSFLFVFILNIYGLKAQISANPAIFTANQAVTLTYDATQSQGQALANLPASVTSITAHIGAILTDANGTTWTNVPGTWGDPAAQPKFTRTGTTNIYTLTLPNGIRSMFGAPLVAPSTTPIFRVGMVLRENGACGNFSGVATACKEGKSSTGQDIFLNVNQGTFDVALSTSIPSNSFVNVGNTINISATANIAGNLVIRVNGTQVAAQNNATSLNHTLNIVSATAGYNVEVIGTPTAGAPITRTANFLIRQTPTSQAVPSGILDGITYNSTDASRLTLAMTAPEKKFVYVVGDFNNWQLNPNYLMRQTPNYGGSGAGSNPDNNRYWIELQGLTPGVEYRFQYWVYDLNENLVKIAEMYSEKVLDPNNDQFISAVSYPNPTPYPAGQNGFVSVLQTGQMPYAWSNATLNFVKPDKKRLNIYELWVHDFDANRNFQDVINRLDYIQNLGINVLQLMPVNEFTGNIGWGYSPIFYTAVDKMYGTREKLKELIDKCHQRGIAVVLDIVLNQAEFEFPGCKMYWNSATNQPSANNPWFNVQATHPFNVFQDFNHDSPYTRKFAERVIKYWINEYKIDGYRYDLAKGFTQRNTTDVGAWNAYDAGRVANIKRIADWQWQADGTSYVILEFLGEGGAEEKEYADYRLNDPLLGGTAQGGMMMWRNMEQRYAQNIMGFASNNSIAVADFDQGSNAFQQPRVISYMESHDEERVMYKALQFGNTSQAGQGHNVRTLNTALKRVEPAILMQMPITGPKMIWQFGELGYDFSLNRCPNGTQGTGDQCRTDPKPLAFSPPQSFDQNANRNDLYKFYAAVNQLKLKYDAFMATNVQIYEGDFSGLVKQLRIQPEPFNASPTNPNQANIVIVTNFDVVSQTIGVRFNHTGTWYSYFENNATFNVTNLNPPGYQAVTLGPGEYRLFTDVQMVNLLATPTIMANLVTASPSIISNTSAVTLNWSGTNVTSNATGITIRRCIAPANTVCETITLPPTATSYVDNTVAQQTTYTYTIVAFNVNGTTTSNSLQVTTLASPPVAPSNLISSNLTASSVNLQWTDNSTDEVGFRVQRKTGVAGTYTDLGASNLAANTTSTSDATIMAGNTYFYRVASIKGAGMSETRTYSNEISISTNVPDATPTALTAVAQVGGTSIVLNWTDGATNETGVRVLRSSTLTGTYSVVANLSANTLNYTDTGLTELTRYFYKIENFNIFGQNQSVAADATTLMTAPMAPTNLTLNLTNGNTAVSLQWADNSNNEAGFVIKRKASPTGTYSPIFTTAANVTTYTDASAPLASAYTYQVCAVRGTAPNQLEACSDEATTSSILSLESNAFAQAITIYPNPANETIKVRLPQILRMVSIEVRDVMGKSIATLQMPENEIETSFDVSKFAQGTYFLHFSTEKGKAVKKMIKR